MSKVSYLLTGATGFLGKHFVEVLKNDNLITVGRSKQSDICVDLATQIPSITNSVDMVIHNAGKAHSVPRTPEEEKLFFDVNYQGTKNLCEAFNQLGSFPKTFVLISTVAVYGKETGTNISEQDALLGETPYAKSKIQAEKFVKQWSKEHNVNCVILRLPLVAGKNPPGNLEAMIKGITKGYYFGIGDSKAQKSVVLAQDIAQLIPTLFEKQGTYNLTDAYHPSFKELEELVAKQLQKKAPKSLPLFLVKLLGVIGNIWAKFPINSDKIQKITSDLTFDDSLAQKELNWNPHRVIDKFEIS